MTGKRNQIRDGYVVSMRAFHSIRNIIALIELEMEGLMKDWDAFLNSIQRLGLSLNSKTDWIAQEEAINTNNNVQFSRAKIKDKNVVPERKKFGFFTLPD